jgi:hypothetical protein
MRIFVYLCSHITSGLKKQYQYQDYPNGCYQINGMNNHPMGYPLTPNYGTQGYQPTPPGLFGYSRAGSPTMNPMYPYSNVSHVIFIYHQSLPFFFYSV